MDFYRPYCEYFEGLPGHGNDECHSLVRRVIFYNPPDSKLEPSESEILFSCEEHAAEFAKEEGFVRMERFCPGPNECAWCGGDLTPTHTAVFPKTSTKFHESCLCAFMETEETITVVQP